MEAEAVPPTLPVMLVLVFLLGGTAPPARGEDALRAIARDAYVFTFPLHETYRVRYQMLYSPANPRRVPPNQFLKGRQLADHTSRRVTAPNNDTLYSSAFLDLSRGPLVLDVPEITDRYYSFAVMDFYTNNTAYVGTRTTGTRARTYPIVGPAWRGTAPQGGHVIASPTNAVWLLGRFLVSDASDLPRAHRLQDAVSSLRSPLAAPLPSSTVRRSSRTTHGSILRSSITLSRRIRHRPVTARSSREWGRLASAPGASSTRRASMRGS